MECSFETFCSLFLLKENYNVIFRYVQQDTATGVIFLFFLLYKINFKTNANMSINWMICLQLIGNRFAS